MQIGWVYRDKRNDSLFRIIWIDKNDEGVYKINMDKTILPIYMKKSYLFSLYEQNIFEKVVDPYDSKCSFSERLQCFESMYFERLQALKSISIKNAESVLDRKKRRRQFELLSQGLGISDKSISRYFILYLQFGCPLQELIK